MIINQVGSTQIRTCIVRDYKYLVQITNILFKITKILFKITHILFEITKILFEITKILSEFTNILFKITNIMFKIPNILLEITNIFFEITNILFKITNILYKITNILFVRMKKNLLDKIIVKMLLPKICLSISKIWKKILILRVKYVLLPPELSWVSLKNIIFWILNFFFMWSFQNWKNLETALWPKLSYFETSKEGITIIFENFIIKQNFSIVIYMFFLLFI